jgi:GABA(A) receptor-associated protein
MIKDASQILQKHPDRIPCIVNRSQRSTLPDIDKHNFLVPRDLTMGQFMYIIRKRIKLPESMSLLLMSSKNNSMFTQEITMGMVYEQHRHPDGFLYLIYTGENTFGK